MNKYRFLYWTKKNDVLREEFRHFANAKEARRFAKILYANSNILDLHRISVRRIYE